ncbi:hypothetical protein AX760_09590 [Pararhizobium antarcticum]|uniref:Uncharacterized protein n=1 Tax=Pararhizobium antarcticum TaxID=1798805 RepID=A0A657LYT4_9HYPH|nr:hypothetical protein AX761_18390 [Rhizobium sp. 58]OJG00716.1 hypothetical protein AX760_09590 [Pararhizobium antarcticum]
MSVLFVSLPQIQLPIRVKVALHLAVPLSRAHVYRIMNNTCGQTMTRPQAAANALLAAIGLQKSENT